MAMFAPVALRASAAGRMWPALEKVVRLYESARRLYTRRQILINEDAEEQAI